VSIHKLTEFTRRRVVNHLTEEAKELWGLDIDFEQFSDEALYKILALCVKTEEFLPKLAKHLQGFEKDLALFEVTED
jgi:hypothetical protein